MKTCRNCGTKFETGYCVPCRRVSHLKAVKKYNAAHPERVRARKEKYRANNKEKISAYRKKYNAEHAKQNLDYGRKWAKENPDKLKAGYARWYAKNSDKAKANAARWKLGNPERVIALIAEWRAKNREKVVSTRERWYAANAEIVKAAVKKWREKHPDAVKVHGQNRRRAVSGRGKLSIGLSERLLKLQRGKCACCGKPLGDNYHLDHRMPLALGGANEDWNMQLLRDKCNLSKGAKHPVDFMQSRGFLL